ALPKYDSLGRDLASWRPAAFCRAGAPFGHLFRPARHLRRADREDPLPSGPGHSGGVAVRSKKISASGGTAIVIIAVAWAGGAGCIQHVLIHRGYWGSGSVDFTMPFGSRRTRQ